VANARAETCFVDEHLDELGNLHQVRMKGLTATMRANPSK
jgi:hypothetical protein